MLEQSYTGETSHTENPSTVPAQYSSSQSELENVPSLGSFLEREGDLEIDIARLIETRMLIQAGSGGGKSWAIRRILEQTAPFVQQLVIDPEGEFRSLAEAGNYLMCGSATGDISLTHGGELAYTLMEQRTSAIIDLSELDPEERDLFVSEFVAQLVRLPQKMWSHTLVVIDEAHILCPQHDKSEAKKAIIDLCARGRKRGLCPILATQRISKLHKSAAAELQNRLMGLTILDVDVKRAADEMGISLEKASQILPELNVGEFYAFGPALCKLINKVKVGSVMSRHGFLSGDIKPPTRITKDIQDSVTEKFKFVMRDKQENEEKFSIQGENVFIGGERYKLGAETRLVVATNDLTGNKHILEIQMLNPIDTYSSERRKARKGGVKEAKRTEPIAGEQRKRGRRLLPDVEAIVSECVQSHRSTGMKPPLAFVYGEIQYRCETSGLRPPTRITVQKRMEWLQPDEGKGEV